jgi:hypothetical protein
MPGRAVQYGLLPDDERIHEHPSEHAAIYLTCDRVGDPAGTQLMELIPTELPPLHGLYRTPRRQVLSAIDAADPSIRASCRSV